RGQGGEHQPGDIEEVGVVGRVLHGKRGRARGHDRAVERRRCAGGRRRTVVDAGPRHGPGGERGGHRATPHSSALPLPSAFTAIVMEPSGLNVGWYVTCLATIVAEAPGRMQVTVTSVV